ncbi:MAG: hypothetical protein LQ339_000592 [Xanthoria mediterranea]|nr:MAG: hypothetical protein LQ339_000592 [Xanthoria mediterranea]
MADLQLSLRATRVEDYLNDKLQTTADLEGLDILLENVQTQQDLLKQQLLEAEKHLAETTKASEAHRSALLQQARTFKNQQADVDRRLLIVTRSETSDDAIGKFDADIKALQHLDVATGYVELLAQVEDLSAEARRNFKSSPQAALQPYLGLQKLAIALKEAQPAAEDAAPHLVDHVEKTAQHLWKQMKDAFASDFEKVLTRMKWPSKDVSLAGSWEQEWTEGVEKLLELQEPELNIQNDHIKPDEEPLVLLPLEVMVKPLDLRFQYHFSGDRPTNKLDKPEYFLSHIMGLINNYNDFFATYLQPLLRTRFRTSNLSMTSIFIDSTSALITALLPMLRRKVFGVIPQVAKQPQLLSHFIHELMSFDISLRDEWGYDGGSGVDGWKGLTWEVLVKKDWFGRWLEVEKTFALSRYQNIIDPSESFEIDYESVEPSATKPTNAAIRVNDLLETITDRYRPLPSFSQKLRFLIDIQIAIFDLFHSRLVGFLDDYLKDTSSLFSTVQGVSSSGTKQKLPTEGIVGLERLIRVYGSAEYLEKKMRDWSDDVFFLELWEELQDRVRANTTSQGPKHRNLAGNMTVEHVADKTSAAVGNEEGGGALFDETAGAYRRLRVRTEGVITDTFVQQIRSALSAYGKINPWSALSLPLSEGDELHLAISAELDAPVGLLSSYLSFLAKALAQAPLKRIARQVVLAMQAFLWDSVLMPSYHRFSYMGAKQFGRDVRGIWEVVDRFVGAGQGKVGMRRLAEGLVLLELDGGGAAATGAAVLKLRDVEKRLFKDNESGREVLEALGLEVLSESEARGVLQTRIDLNG